MRVEQRTGALCGLPISGDAIGERPPVFEREPDLPGPHSRTFLRSARCDPPQRSRRNSRPLPAPAGRVQRPARLCLATSSSTWSDAPTGSRRCTRWPPPARPGMKRSTRCLRGCATSAARSIISDCSSKLRCRLTKCFHLRCPTSIRACAIIVMTRGH